MRLDGKTIVITGGGSGIGRALVLAALARGARVAALDLRMEGLEETAALADVADRLSLHACDISDRVACNAMPDAVLAEHGQIDALINNAGIIQPFVDFADLDDAVIDRMVSVNLMGPINMTRAFLPELLARPEAALINVASMGGFIPFPGQSMYGAAKAGVKAMTEALYQETRSTKLSVGCAMPGAVATNITQNSGVEAFGNAEDGAMQALAPDAAARIILDGMEAGTLHILVGKDAKMLWRLVRLAPAFAIRLIQKQMAKLSS